MLSREAFRFGQCELIIGDLENILVVVKCFFFQKLDKENLRCSINELVYITAKGYLKVSGIKIPVGEE